MDNIKLCQVFKVYLIFVRVFFCFPFEGSWYFFCKIRYMFLIVLNDLISSIYYRLTEWLTDIWLTWFVSSIQIFLWITCRLHSATILPCRTLPISVTLLLKSKMSNKILVLELYQLFCSHVPGPRRPHTSVLNNIQVFM